MRNQFQAAQEDNEKVQSRFNIEEHTSVVDPIKHLVEKMTSLTKDKSHQSVALSHHVLSWLGTFVAAGFQLSFTLNDEKNPEVAKKKLLRGLRMAILGPTLGFGMFKVFSHGEIKGSIVPIATASLIGSGLLRSEDEVESVNSIVWLRVASGIWSGLNRRGIDLMTHLAIVITFYGVFNHEDIAPSALVKMTRKFLTPSVFNSVQSRGSKENEDDERISTSLLAVWKVFRRTFRGLFVYNYFLHFAAALVGYAVRVFGSKAAKVGKVVSSNVTNVLVQAAKEATILNTAVSASCAILVAGSRTLGSGAGILCMPFPLYFCAPRVRDTVYYLFMPWCAKFVFRLYDANRFFNARARLLLGVYMLEGPLRAISSNHEGYGWMIGVAFGMVKVAGAGLI